MKAWGKGVRAKVAALIMILPVQGLQDPQRVANVSRRQPPSPTDQQAVQAETASMVRKMLGGSSSSSRLRR